MDEPRNTSPAARSADDRLDSWKAIASHLGRDVTTVQRWEKREGLPVHRHVHDKLGSIYAYRGEIDVWLRQRASLGGAKAPTLADVPGAGAASEPDRTEPTPKAAPPPMSPVPARRRPVALIGGALVVAAAVGWWLAPRPAFVLPNPLDAARYRVVTDFEGTEQAAAISRDGQFVAFVSDRDGQPDVWVTRLDTSRFYNLTQGRVRELINPDVRTLGFSPDGSQVTFWARGVAGATDEAIGVWAAPTMGGAPRPYLDGVAEYDWDRRGTRLVAHTAASGDPTFVDGAPGEPGRTPVFKASDGRHAHFPTWSLDGKWVYVVLGAVPDALDVHRMHPDGTALERLTEHNARVTHPVFLDARTLLYLVSDGENAGGVLHALDIETLTSRPLAHGIERYHSLAASADGRRIVATIANTKGTLWRVPLGDGAEPAAMQGAAAISLPTGNGRSPRYGPGFLLYVSSSGERHALWKLADSGAAEIWSTEHGRVEGGPAISADGRRVAMTVEQTGRTRLYVMNADGTGARVVGDVGELRGEPSWAPDAQSLTSGAQFSGASQFFRRSESKNFINETTNDGLASTKERNQVIDNQNHNTDCSGDKGELSNKRKVRHSPHNRSPRARDSEQGKGRAEHIGNQGGFVNPNGNPIDQCQNALKFRQKERRKVG
jgi:Tol biopolymer transport system component